MDVEIRYIDENKGKGLFAKRAFERDSTILEEEPLVSVQFSWNRACRYKACDFCMRPMETAEENARRLTGKPNLELPYPECCPTDKTKFSACSACGTEYCSVECQIAAYNDYHKILCFENKDDPQHPLNKLNEEWKEVHYPPETNSIMLVIRLLAKILQAPNVELAISQTMQFSHRTVNESAQISHKMLGVRFADQLTTLHDFVVKAIPNEGIEELLTVEGFYSLLSLIGTNGQGIGTSVLSKWIANTFTLDISPENRESLDNFIDQLYDEMNNFTGDFYNNEGVGLYPIESTCNHSCRPNAAPSFNNNTHRLSLVALDHIEEGEEITISYLDECFLIRSRYSRRKELMENYLFACVCPKCEEQINEPDGTSEDEYEYVEDDSMSL